MLKDKFGRIGNSVHERRIKKNMLGEVESKVYSFSNIYKEFTILKRSIWGYMKPLK